jgi:hypothetical protein
MMGSMLSGAGAEGMDPGMAGMSTASGPAQTPIGEGAANPSALNSPEAMANMSGNLQSAWSFANLLGSNPDERTKNARAFASMVQQLGKMGKDVSESTLLQRMMKGRIRPIAELTSGQQSGGTGPMPEYSGPATAPIMSNTTFGAR